MINRVIEIFKDICSIPHGSNNEHKLVEYIEDFAKKNGLDFRKDEAGNAVVCKNLKKGKGSGLTVVLQAHLDMVCEKLPEIEHDFSTRGIEMYIEGDSIKARGTTLGADNGIGVAMILACLESDETADSRIAGLFTVAEEIGMIGAQNIDPELISGDILISLDFGGEGCFCVGCAGGSKIEAGVNAKFDKVLSPSTVYYFSLSGLKGGHSGLDIGDGRLNAIKTLAECIDRLLMEFPGDLDVCEFDCAGKGGVIPSNAGVFIACKDDRADAVKQTVKMYYDELIAEKGGIEPGLKLSFEPSDRIFCEKYNTQVLGSVINAIKELAQGVISVDEDEPSIVETSQNIDLLQGDGNKVKLVVSQRSLDADKLNEAIYSAKAVLGKYGFNITDEKRYSGWRMDQDSEIVHLFLNEYKKMYNCNVYKKFVHAGLECGTLSDRLGISNVIAFGATCSNVHTVNETASVSSTERAFMFLMHMLEILAKDR